MRLHVILTSINLFVYHVCCLSQNVAHDRLQFGHAALSLINIVVSAHLQQALLSADTSLVSLKLAARFFIHLYQQWQYGVTEQHTFSMAGLTDAFAAIQDGDATTDAMLNALPHAMLCFQSRYTSATVTLAAYMLVTALPPVHDADSDDDGDGGDHTRSDAPLLSALVRSLYVFLIEAQTQLAAQDAAKAGSVFSNHLRQVSIIFHGLGSTSIFYVAYFGILPV